MADARVKIKFGRVDTEVEGPENFVLQVWNFLEDLIRKEAASSNSETGVSEAKTKAEVEEAVSKAALETKEKPVAKEVSAEVKQAEGQTPATEQVPEKQKKKSIPESQPSPEVVRVPFDPELKAFLDKKKPNTRIKRTLVFAYYLKHYKGKQEFTPEDIWKCYRSVGMTPPPRFKQDIYDGLLDRYGYFARSETQRGHYVITETGEQVVDVMGMEE